MSEHPHAHPDQRQDSQKDGQHDGELADLFTEETWDARYSESERVWSGAPNQRLVEQAGTLPPGDALDVGAGEGADAVWLASRGWQVTALDVSGVALARTAAHAEGAGVGDRVLTLRHDLLGPAPIPGRYDLVTAHYWHPPADRFAELLGRLAAVVRDGGALLVVGHHPVDLATGRRSAHGHPELLYTPDQVVAALPGEGWQVQVADEPTRDVDGSDGPVTLTDTVVLAIRR